MNLLAAEQRGISGTKLLFAASSGELTQAPQPPSPSPEGEGVQGMRLIKEKGYLLRFYCFGGKILPLVCLFHGFRTLL